MSSQGQRGGPGRQQGMMEYSCHVGDLAWATDAGSLERAFSQFGKILNAKIIYHRETGRSRGFGFVTFATAGARNAAIQAMDGHDLDGRYITVNEAHPSGGGGYGGHGGGYGGHGGSTLFVQQASHQGDCKRHGGGSNVAFVAPTKDKEEVAAGKTKEEVAAEKLAGVEEEVRTFISSLKSNARCYNCGDPGHIKVHCPNFTCHRCSGRGHPERVCPSPQHMCMKCGRDTHATWRCVAKHKITCTNCGGLGHHNNKCPSYTVVPRCTGCGMYGHHLRNCPQRTKKRGTDPHFAWEKPGMCSLCKGNHLYANCDLLGH